MCRFQPSQTDQKRLLEHPFLTNCVEPAVFLFSRPRLSDSGPPSQTDQSHPNSAIPIAEFVKVPLRQFQQFCQAHISAPACRHFDTCSIPGLCSAGFIVVPVSSGAITASSSVIRGRRRLAGDRDSKNCIPGSEKRDLTVDALLRGLSVSLFGP